MEEMRKRFQGVLNIIRFNWHFYILAIVLVLLSVAIAPSTGSQFETYLKVLALLITAATSVSLLVRFMYTTGLAYTV
jgi:hypothetical protein